MSKGIAIRTILLLLIGVIVAGIIIYFVYSMTRTQVLTCTECRAEFIQYCTSCKLANTGKETWDVAGPGMNANLQGCATGCGLHDTSGGTETDCDSTKMQTDCSAAGVT